MTRFRKLLIAILSFSLVLAGGLYGCGKKGDPRPSGVAPPKAVSNLTASLGDRGVVLRWTIQRTEELNQRYRIERSELLAKGTTCPECPLEYAVLADIPFDDPKLTKENADTVNYVDSGIKAGYIYTYRITVCDVSGLCSQASNIGEVVVGSDYTRGK